ncbi:hypothetical protein GH714_041489 [Hevea brasiliensis]|uniref:Cellulose synthase-like protein G3 n=1 Tax=Hevea brasiliensis TaxID=3981 RepID=A0A6A6MQU1_HEVBR|nr:hypothetical protein GH714_041489 [Hevea brasiliensis]
MWSTAQASRLYPIQRKELPENLDKVVKRSDYPAVDVIICTADPTREPPMSVVNTALSVMAYDYPTEKLSVYVSDDGGSALTLFAFMEAAKFAAHWLPFCRENNIVQRNPESYFESNYSSSSEAVEIIKMMYESMKMRVEHVVEKGKIGDEYITSDEERQAFNQWTHNFTSQDHPTVIQVLLANNRSKDVTGNFMPNLIYVSREKSSTSHHHFKAGALNVLMGFRYGSLLRTFLRVINYVVRVGDPCFAIQIGQRFWGMPHKLGGFVDQLKRSQNHGFCCIHFFPGAYWQDYFDFVSANGTFQMWWNDQRIWTIRGLTSLWFGSLEFLLKSLGILTHDFSLTSKVVDDEQSKRYDQGIFDFGSIAHVCAPNNGSIDKLSVIYYGAGRSCQKQQFGGTSNPNVHSGIWGCELLANL